MKLFSSKLAQTNRLISAALCMLAFSAPLQANPSTQIGLEAIQYYIPGGSCLTQKTVFVYKKSGHPNYKAAILLHGGGWRDTLRPSAVPNGPIVLKNFSTPSKTMADYLTDLGYVVFIPFYSTNSLTGILSCDSLITKSEHITGDVQKAFDWVDANKVHYGVNGGKIDVVGTSAGGHLALWLTFNNMTKVGRTLALVPPSNLGQLVNRPNPDGPIDPNYNYYNSLHRSASDFNGIRQYYNALIFDYQHFDLNNNTYSPNPLYWREINRIKDNSFHNVINATPNRNQIPGLVVLHGIEDNAVPIEQSTELCTVLGQYATINQAPVVETNAYSTTRKCGQTNKHFFSEQRYLMHGIAYGATCDASAPSCSSVTAEYQRSMTKAIHWLNTGIWDTSL